MCKLNTNQSNGTKNLKDEEGYFILVSRLQEDMYGPTLLITTVMSIVSKE